MKKLLKILGVELASILLHEIIKYLKGGKTNEIQAKRKKTIQNE